MKMAAIALLVALFMLLLDIAGAKSRAEDYWSDCKEAYLFCAERPYHRDCAIWTHYGKPLSVTRVRSPPSRGRDASVIQFCRDNPWHFACGRQDREQCPLPETP